MNNINYQHKYNKYKNKYYKLKMHGGGIEPSKINYVDAIDRSKGCAVDIYKPPIGTGSFGTVYRAKSISHPDVICANKQMVDSYYCSIESDMNEYVYRIVNSRFAECLQFIINPIASDCRRNKLGSYTYSFINTVFGGRRALDLFTTVLHREIYTQLRINILNNIMNIYGRILYQIGVIWKDAALKNVLYQLHEVGYIKLMLIDYGMSIAFTDDICRINDTRDDIHTLQIRNDLLHPIIYGTYTSSCVLLPCIQLIESNDQKYLKDILFLNDAAVLDQESSKITNNHYDKNTIDVNYGSQSYRVTRIANIISTNSPHPDKSPIQHAHAIEKYVKELDWDIDEHNVIYLIKNRYSNLFEASMHTRGVYSIYTLVNSAVSDIIANNYDHVHMKPRIHQCIGDIYTNIGRAKATMLYADEYTAIQQKFPGDTLSHDPFIQPDHVNFPNYKQKPRFTDIGEYTIEYAKLNP